MADTMTAVTVFADQGSAEGNRTLDTPCSYIGGRQPPWSPRTFPHTPRILRSDPAECNSLVWAQKLPLNITF